MVNSPLEVDLWWVPLSADRAAQTAAWHQLDAGEQARAARFHFAADRNHYVLAHAALRAVLGNCLTRDPRDLRFAAGPAGKPHLAEPAAPRLHFNLSHAGDCALIGLNTHAPIGVDLEATTRQVEAADIVERFFAPAEREVWRRIPQPDTQAAFFRAWTRKEAYVKARGDGLGHDASRFVVTFAEAGSARLVADEIDPQAPARFQLIPVPAPSGYEAACALQVPPHHPVKLKIHSWP